MAKEKDSKNQEDLTYMGQSIDPNVQKKVDDFMELDGSESLPAAETGDVVMGANSEAGGAPLLPTDKLPEVAKATKQTSKINVKHDDEPVIEPVNATVDEGEVEVNKPEPEVEQVDSEVETSEIPKDSKPENPDNQELEDPETKESAKEPPLDSEIIDLEKAPEEVEDPDFDREKLDESKTVGELSEISVDKELDSAVDEIVASDADKLLEIEDKELGVNQPEPTKIVLADKTNFFKAWFSNPFYRMITIFGLLLLLAAAIVIPSSRYFMLNTGGVRVSTSMKILDDKTGLPLKNAEIIVGKKSAKSDSEGKVKLDKIKLGKTDIIIKKLAFADVKKTIILGFGSNPLGEVRLVPTGSQYTFIAKDYISNKPITTAEVTMGDSSSKFNSNGEAVLTIPVTDKDEIEVSILADSYRTEKVKISTKTKEKTDVIMVPAKTHSFVSKRSGKFDLYKIDADGKNEKVILSATGIEKEESLSLSTHPKKPAVAFASSRENIRNKDGFLLTTLSLIYLDTNEVVKVAQSERIQLIDWSGDNLIYVKITQGASAANVNRHKIMSYDIEKNTEKELASTNYFNDIVSVSGVVYYSPAVYQVNGKVGLYKINADGTNKKQIYDKEVWNIFRTAYDKFSLAVGQDWYEMNIGSDEVKKIGGAPSVLKSRVYINSPNQKHSIWVDERDGKSVLIDYSLDSKKDQNLLTESGVRNPIYWLDDDHLVYRISDSDETADYVLSLSGGLPKKIKDVTNTVGVDRWYYF